MGIIFKLRQFCKRETLLNLYYTLVYPYLTYCNIIWVSAYKTTLNPIYILQKRMVRAIAGHPPLAHTEPLFEDLKIIQFKYLHPYLISQFMYKLYKQDLPIFSQTMFSQNTNMYEYNTRQRQGLHLPIVKSNRSKMFLCYTGSIIWNRILNLPSVDINSSLNVFKKQIRAIVQLLPS